MRFLSVISALQYVSLLGLPLEQSATTAEEMIRMQEQNRRLSSIRDAILPMLLSGTLPVSKIKTRFSEAIYDVNRITPHSLWSEQMSSSF